MPRHRTRTCTYLASTLVHHGSERPATRIVRVAIQALVTRFVLVVVVAGTTDETGAARKGVGAAIGIAALAHTSVSCTSQVVVAGHGEPRRTSSLITPVIGSASVAVVVAQTKVVVVRATATAIAESVGACTI